MARGRKTGGGSRKGCPNRTSKTLKEMLLGALAKGGGEAYLIRQMEANPSDFMRLLGRLLPTQLTGDSANPIEINVMTTAQRQERARRLIREAFAPFSPAEDALVEPLPSLPAPKMIQ
jgi:hypothetical protein